LFALPARESSSGSGTTFSIESLEYCLFTPS
jgi:hypothetical protein